MAKITRSTKKVSATSKAGKLVGNPKGAKNTFGGAAFPIPKGASDTKAAKSSAGRTKSGKTGPRPQQKANQKRGSGKTYKVIT